MHKIAAFLTFNNKVEKRILHFKKKVKSKFGKQIYLNHPVHLTLFTLNVKKLDELKKLYYGVNLKKKNKSIKVSILSAGVFFNDPITGGHTLYFSLKKKIYNLCIY